MKKISLMVVACMMVLCACGKQENAVESAAEASAEESASTEESIDDFDEEESLVESQEESTESSETSAEAAIPDVIDLTQMSSTMVYSEVYNMLMQPDLYMGKEIRMKGLYYSSYSEEQDVVYTACIIQDAAACCAQGLQFRLVDGHTYPEDYPEENQEVIITGTFTVISEGSYVYGCIMDAQWEAA